MKKITLEALLERHKTESYEAQCRYIKKLTDARKIKPVKSSKTNGKRPALYQKYWLLEEQKDYRLLEEELKYHIVPSLSVDYYLTHLAAYETDRPWVLCLNNYLKERGGNLAPSISVNERSFEIWGDEKFLARGRGSQILKRCGLPLSFFHVYRTTEPLAYYSHTKKTPQNLLIIENKDTFYSMRRHMSAGNEELLGEKIGTLIYGAGKGIFRAFEDFGLCVEPYMTKEENVLYYFGDLDYEGIGIYENLAAHFLEQWEMVPFVGGYMAMLKKAARMERLPRMKEGQNKNMDGRFFSYFSRDCQQAMREILERGCYIPQEILNVTDF